MSPLRIALVALLGLTLAAPAASAERAAPRRSIPRTLRCRRARSRTRRCDPATSRSRARSPSPAASPDGDGIEVHVTVSDAYVPDPSSDQAFVNFLGSLIHGSELASLQAVILAPEEVAQVCGAEAVGCYSPAAQTLIVPGESVDGACRWSTWLRTVRPPRRNRLNPPWEAGDWGTKALGRTDADLLAERSGRSFPGDEATTTSSIRARLGRGVPLPERRADRRLADVRLARRLLALRP